MTTSTPRPMPTPDLGSILKSRPAGAAPTSSTARPAPATPDHAEIDKSATVATLTPPTEDRRPRRQARPADDAASRTRPARPATRTYVRPINLRLPRSIHQALAAEAGERGMTQVVAILTAVSQTHAELGSQLAAPEPPSTWDGELFTIPQLRPAAEPVVQTSIRVTDAQLEALDTLAELHGVQRSQIVTAALRLWLPS